MRIVVLLCAAVAIACPAQLPAKEKRPEENSERICRALHVSGSRIERPKACATAEEWAEFDKRNRITGGFDPWMDGKGKVHHCRPTAGMAPIC